MPAFMTGRFHHAVATAFVACLTDGAPSPAGLTEGRAALAMVLAAYRAAASGRVIKI